jgi:hypothetical protein
MKKNFFESLRCSGGFIEVSLFLICSKVTGFLKNLWSSLRYQKPFFSKCAELQGIFLGCFFFKKSNKQERQWKDQNKFIKKIHNH